MISQFGPVNNLVCDDDEEPNHYEWSHYSIEDFKKEWSPEEFK